MSDTIVILTGASRGLGAAFAMALCEPGTTLVTLARHTNPALAAHAASRGTTLQQHQVDLSDPHVSVLAVEQIFASLPRGAAHYRLINNAGTVDPISSAVKLDPIDIVKALNLNVGVLMLLTSRFLEATAGLAADRRILNISSGAGRKPVAGWSVYCATKAAVDMFSRTVKLEQTDSGLRIASLAPGVIDTAMQGQIRNSDSDDFPALENFQSLHASGQLAAPADVAGRILAYLERDDFGNTEIDDIRNY